MLYTLMLTTVTRVDMAFFTYRKDTQRPPNNVKIAQTIRRSI